MSATVARQRRHDRDASTGTFGYCLRAGRRRLLIGSLLAWILRSEVVRPEWSLYFSSYFFIREGC